MCVCMHAHVFACGAICMLTCVRVCAMYMFSSFIGYPPAFSEKDRLYCISGVVQFSGIGSHLYIVLLLLLPINEGLKLYDYPYHDLEQMK